LKKYEKLKLKNMKRILFVLTLFVLSNCVLFSQNSLTTESANNNEIELLKSEIQSLKQEIDELSGQQENFTKKVEDVNHANKNFLETFDCAITFLQWFVSIIVIIAGIFIYISGLKGKTGIDEYKKELEDNMKREMERLNDKTAIQIAQILNKNPMAIKEFIESQLREQNLRKDTSICILYKNKHVLENVRLELIEEGFEKIEERMLEEGEILNEVLKSVNEDIVLVADGNNAVLCKMFAENKLKIKSLSRVYFYYGEVDEALFPHDISKPIGYANSIGKISQNIGSLIKMMKKK